MTVAKTSSPRVMLVAGELSGDHHGAALAKALKDASPQIELLGVGGAEMTASGVQLLFDISSLAVVGAWEVLAKLKHICQAFFQLSRQLKTNPPDLLILIDYPDFNLRLARVAKKQGIKILYYISPQVWAWRKGRTRQIAHLVNKIAVVLPFEEPLYKQVGADAQFVGHPLLDALPVCQPAGPEISPAEKIIVGLLPGSRQNEIKLLLDPLLKAAQLLKKQHPQVSFLLPVASSLDYREIEQQVACYELPIELTRGQAHEVMEKASLIIVASGTATLEAALVEVPMVVVYKVAWLTYLLGRILVDTPYIALVNVVADKLVVPELIQEQASAERIAACAGEFLSDENKLAAMKAELAKVREKLGTPGASRRVARMALDLISQARKEH